MLNFDLLCRWKLLDFAVLKCSSVSFFEIEKPETAVSRWSRARTRAAKVLISLRTSEWNDRLHSAIMSVKHVDMCYKTIIVFRSSNH